MQPGITVIIANRNYSSWISDAIFSVYNQNYEGLINLAIVDDGSTDNSVKNIEAALCIINKDKNENIAVLQLDTNENVENRLGCGPSFARNIGIKYALDNFEQEVFVILDADDWYLPEKIRRSVQEWQKDPENIGVVYADYYICDEEGNIKKEFKPEFSHITLLQECIVHSNSLISKKALLDTAVNGKFYDETLRTCEDYDLWCRIAKKFVIKHIPEFLMNVRITGQNSTFSVPQEVWNSNYRTVKERYAKAVHS